VRDVREHGLFAEAKAKLDVHPRALDEALEALVWALSRDAERYPRLPGKRTRVAFTRGTLRVKPLMVHFVIREDEGVVELLWVEVA
jgi:hypothetical protein